MQVENLLSVIIINFEPALRKPVLVRKFLFHLFWHSVAIQASFCKVAGQNRKKLLPEIFLSYQKKKKNLLHGCFHNLATPLQMIF